MGENGRGANLDAGTHRHSKYRANKRTSREGYRDTIYRTIIGGGLNMMQVNGWTLEAHRKEGHGLAGCRQIKRIISAAPIKSGKELVQEK